MLQVAEGTKLSVSTTSGFSSQTRLCTHAGDDGICCIKILESWCFHSDNYCETTKDYDNCSKIIPQRQPLEAESKLG